MISLDLHQNTLLSSKGQKVDIMTKGLNGDQLIQLHSSPGFKIHITVCFLSLMSSLSYSFFEENVMVFVVYWLHLMNTRCDQLAALNNVYFHAFLFALCCSALSLDQASCSLCSAEL
jgi:hypothetical protein